MTKDEARRRLGHLIDDAEPCLNAIHTPTPPTVRADALKVDFRILVDNLKELYIDLGGMDEWEDTPTDPNLQASLGLALDECLEKYT